MGCPKGCDYFVDCGGLKLLFPILMEKALVSASDDEAKTTRGQCISILVSLLLFCRQEYKVRVAAKFEENEGEKMKQVGIIYNRINEQLHIVDQKRPAILRELEIEDEEEAELEMMNIKLEKGYTTLLNCAFLFSALPVVNHEVDSSDVQMKQLCSSVSAQFNIDKSQLQARTEEMMKQTDDRKTQTAIHSVLGHSRTETG